MRAGCLGARAAVLPSLVGGIDVAAGQRSRAAQPGCGRTAPTAFSDRIRNDVAMPITAVGDIDGPHRVHAVLPARANLGCLVGQADPCGTAYAAATSGDRRLPWPTSQYAVRGQRYRLAARTVTGKVSWRASLAMR
jgi:anthraniloyl-CoA monooxygenase